MPHAAPARSPSCAAGLVPGPRWCLAKPAFLALLPLALALPELASPPARPDRAARRSSRSPPRPSSLPWTRAQPRGSRAGPCPSASARASSSTPRRFRARRRRARSSTIRPTGVHGAILEPRHARRRSRGAGRRISREGAIVRIRERPFAYPRPCAPRARAPVGRPRMRTGCRPWTVPRCGSRSPAALGLGATAALGRGPAPAPAPARRSGLALSPCPLYTTVVHACLVVGLALLRRRVAVRPGALAACGPRAGARRARSMSGRRPARRAARSPPSASTSRSRPRRCWRRPSWSAGSARTRTACTSW